MQIHPRATTNISGGIPVWSEEILLGNPLARRYDGHRNATRIHQIFPNGRILISIRAQNTIALSMYQQYLKERGTCSLKMFIGTGQERTGFRPILLEEHLKYDQAIAYYQALFGKENVVIVPYEFLQSDRKSWKGGVGGGVICAPCAPNQIHP